jgi:hypothetical protein
MKTAERERRRGGHLLGSIVAVRQAEDVGVERHVRRRLRLPPVPARYPGDRAGRRGKEEERGEREEDKKPARTTHAGRHAVETTLLWVFFSRHRSRSRDLKMGVKGVWVSGLFKDSQDLPRHTL